MKQENIKKLETRAVKLLGITIDNNLTYDKHWNNICVKVNKKPTALR